MLIYGAGGHAKVIIDLVRCSGILVEGIFDDDPAKKTLAGIPVSAYDCNLYSDLHLTLAIGDNQIRKKLAVRVGHRFNNVFHPSTLIANNVRFGSGNVVLHGAVIQTNTLIGNHCIINTGAIIDHDCRILDFVHVAPGATLCGHITVGECTLVGAGSVVVPNIIIGKNCLIGAGSIVTKNIPDGCIARGNPARIIKQTHYGQENMAFAPTHGRNGNDLY